MQLILKPVSHPQLGEVIIRDRLFAIGRHEPPFDAFEPAAVVKLSRRHARIFTQDDSVYIVDLDSLNGTTVNGVPLDKQSRQLQQNDEISFAGQLSYRVQLQGGDTASGATASSVLLTLIPEQLESIIEPIVVAEFPFLVSKSDETFSRYSERIPEQFKFLSRRHAHFFVRDHILMVEDLGSTNGTFVSGNRLDEHARTLHDGDTIAFGGNDFIYRVHIKIIEREDNRPLDEASLLTEALHTSTDITRTTFVTSANSFIDIFCVHDEEEEVAAQPEEAVKSGSTGKRRKHGKGGGTSRDDRQKNRISIFLGELRRAFMDDGQPGKRKGLWWGTAVITLVAVLIGISYFPGADKRSIEQLLGEGDYAQSAAQADAYLQQNPQDQEVQELALTALSRYILPDWRKQLETGDFSQARATINGARGMSAHNPSAIPFLQMLDWFTDLEEFILQRGGIDSQIIIFQHEDKIAQFVDWWERDRNEHQRLASRIAQYEPSFAKVHAQALSYLRTLGSEKSLYLVAINELKETLNVSLGKDQFGELETTLTEFSARYPRIAGIERLQLDLRSYRELMDAINKYAWIDATELLDRTEYLTPPFRERTNTIRNEQLPPMEIATKYQQATEQWQQGHGNAAIDILQNLTQGSWGAMASKLLKRRRSIWERYQSLTDAKKDADYPEQLLALYDSLEPVDDSYYVKVLQPEYESYRDKSLQQANQAMRNAKTEWTAYQESGRITGLQRLEATISRQYRRQAKRLGKAFEQARQGAEIYRLLNIDLTDEQQTMFQAILQESRLQMRSLQELKLVLDAKLFKGKVELLPQPVL